MGKLIDSFWEEINRQKEKQERELENRKKEKAFEELSNLDPNVLFNSGQKMIQEVNLPEEIFKNFIKKYVNIKEIQDEVYFVYSPYKLILKISSVPGYHTKKTTFPLCLLVDREGFSKLRNIINSKTEKEFTEENVGVMLFSFLKKMLFEEFDKTLQQRASKEELVENYVNYYEENALTWDKLYFFVEYLKTKYSDFSELIEVKEKVSKLIENKSVSSFEKQLLGGNNISLQDLDKLTGVEFEEFLKKLFEKQGYKAILTPASNDYGADLILEKFGKKIAVQAKRYENTVPSKAIQEVYAAKDYYACQEAWIVTQSELSRNSIRTAEKLGVKIIDREKLKEMI